MKEFITESIQTYTSRRVSRSAAEFAYFLTLSIFPLIICGVYILASFELTIEGMFEELWAADLLHAVLDSIAYAEAIPSAWLVWVSVTVIFTSGSAAFRSIMKIMEDIFGRPRHKGIVGMVYSFIFALLLLFAIYFSVFLISSGENLAREVESFAGVYGLAQFWMRIRFLILFIVLVVVVHVVYIFTTPKKPKFRRLPGAILASLALVIASGIFSNFMAASARYPLLYGSLASFVLLMVWGYLCGNVLICGNVFNFMLYRQQRRKNGEENLPVG